MGKHQQREIEVRLEPDVGLLPRGYAGECRRFKRMNDRRVQGVRHCPFELRHVGEPGEAVRRPEAFEEGRKSFAISMRITGRGRRRDNEAVRHGGADFGPASRSTA